NGAALAAPDVIEPADARSLPSPSSQSSPPSSPPPSRPSSAAPPPIAPPLPPAADDFRAPLPERQPGQA
ncbi:hypothetical protein ISG25_37785, partial [Burkholderia pseudomallei]|nr:hypothetical protein [Burkholderia pseudomallei]MBF3851198.1 hypothetical protein [Burkholderia pseudomallei]